MLYLVNFIAPSKNKSEKRTYSRKPVIPASVLHVNKVRLISCLRKCRNHAEYNYVVILRHLKPP